MIMCDGIMVHNFEQSNDTFDTRSRRHDVRHPMLGRIATVGAERFDGLVPPSWASSRASQGIAKFSDGKGSTGSSPSPRDLRTPTKGMCFVFVFPCQQFYGHTWGCSCTDDAQVRRVSRQRQSTRSCWTMSRPILISYTLEAPLSSLAE